MPQKTHSEAKQRLNDCLGYDVFDKSTHPQSLIKCLEAFKQNPELRTVYKIGETYRVCPITGDRLKITTTDDFPNCTHRKEQGRPYILIDDHRFFGFSRTADLRRAILSQTKEAGFVPKGYFACLIQGRDFDFVEKGRNGKIEVWVTPKTLARICYGKKSPFESKTGLTRDQEFELKQKAEYDAYKEVVEFRAYLSIERFRQGIIDILGFCPGFNNQNSFWTLEREIKAGKPACPWHYDRAERVEADFKRWGIPIPTPDEIAQFKAKIKANKPIRMKQRLAKILVNVKVMIRGR